LTVLGSAENEVSNFTDAIHYFKQALTINPKRIDALVGIGFSFQMLGNNSATIYLKEALK